LAVSQATAEALSQWGVSPDRIHVVHTIMDSDDLYRDSQAPLQEALERALGRKAE